MKLIDPCMGCNHVKKATLRAVIEDLRERASDLQRRINEGVAPLSVLSQYAIELNYLKSLADTYESQLEGEPTPILDESGFGSGAGM